MYQQRNKGPMISHDQIQKAMTDVIHPIDAVPQAKTKKKKRPLISIIKVGIPQPLTKTQYKLKFQVTIYFKFPNQKHKVRTKTIYFGTGTQYHFTGNEQTRLQALLKFKKYQQTGNQRSKILNRFFWQTLFLNRCKNLRQAYQKIDSMLNKQQVDFDAMDQIIKEKDQVRQTQKQHFELFKQAKRRQGQKSGRQQQTKDFLQTFRDYKRYKQNYMNSKK